MAGKFKTSIFSEVFVFCIFLHTVTQCKASGNNEDTDRHTWFSKYEEINLFMRKKDKISTRFVEAELYFSSSDQAFAFNLREEVFPYLNENVKVNIDDKFEVPFSNFAEGLSIYKGSMVSELCNYSAVVKLSPEGLDGILVNGSSKLYLEPFSRYSSNQRQYQNINKKELQFRCIFYKSSDVRMSFNGSGIPWDRLSVTQTNFVFSDTNSDGRYKRNIRDASKTECTLHVVADHLFYQNDGQSDMLSTISKMTYLVLQANLIFRGTDFDGDGTGDNIGFHISKITVYTEPNTYKMKTAKNVKMYLELLTEYDFSEFCLATAFTSRDFQDSVVGLAWVASSSKLGSPGGICQHRILCDSKRLSLNTNLITTSNHGRRIPSYLNALTLAHEFGHSFGSWHDSQNAICSPEGDYGNYLMYPYASDGNKPNNDALSPCSISYMYPVVRNKGTCLKESVISFCGNAFREPGEECDCGTNITCADVDPCCTPSNISNSDPDPPCTFRRSQGSRCSPKHSHCCTDECSIVTTDMNKVCKAKSECKQQSICDGISHKCPVQVIVPDTIPCAGGTKSCKGGLCSGNACATIGQNPCTCSGENTCSQCCLNIDSVCVPFKNDKNEKLPLSIGTSCNAKQGFCDGEGECISVDKSSAMDRLNQVFSGTEMDSVKTWFKSQWYYVVLAVLVFIFLIFLFVRAFHADRHIQTSAYMYGRFMSIQREAELQKAYLERRRNVIETRYKNKIDTLENHYMEMDFPTAVARMMVFFPTAPMNIIEKTLKSSASEEAAVRWLLLRDYPFRRVCKRIDNINVRIDELLT